MNRSRRFLVVLATIAPFAPRISMAQARKLRVGVLSLGSPPAGPLEAFTRELGQLGYVEGHNLDVEWRFAEGSNDRLAGQARELTAMNLDVIFAVSTPAALEAKKATSRIPVVIARVADPVRSGLVKSMARPGGNLTGISSTFSDVVAKLLEFIREALPATSRVAFMWNRRNPGSALAIKELEAASARMGLQFHSLDVERSEDIPVAINAAKLGGASAMTLAEDLFITSHKSNILDLAMRHSLPVFSVSRDFAEAGALVTYGPVVPDMYRRAAHYVDRIFKGARPGDLPVEQPSRYELIVNLSAAQLLGLTLPPALVARADAVIR